MLSNVIIENAQLCPFNRNFSGKAGRYNPAGNRNFCIFIDDPDTINRLVSEGWNIKELPPRDDTEVTRYYTQVAVKFGKIPPKIVLVSSRGKTALNEEDVNMLDWAEITKCDLIIRPFEWEPGHVKGYLKTMYVTIYEDELDLKYNNLPDADGAPQSQEDYPF